MGTEVQRKRKADGPISCSLSCSFAPFLIIFLVGGREEVAVLLDLAFLDLLVLEVAWGTTSWMGQKLPSCPGSQQVDRTVITVWDASTQDEGPRWKCNHSNGRPATEQGMTIATRGA